jgi:hypothetical protein
MEGKRIIKLRNQKIAKRIDFPNNFSDFILKIIEFSPFNEPTKRYQLIEEKSQKEIITEEDFLKMSDEYKNEKLIKITVNIVDKKSNPISNQKPEKNIISTEASINLLSDKKEAKQEIENPMKSILKEKMKELEDKLVEELYNNLKNEISKSNVQNIIELKDDMNKTIHKGIVCNKCGKKNIEGIRYKCAQCPNFNLCEICEDNFNHNIKHIMIKMRYPAKNENELVSRINRNISYKNKDMNYNLEPKEFKMEKEEDNYTFQISLKNIGAAPWREVTLRCINDKSDLIGEECEIDYSVNSGSSINQQLKFYNIKNQLEKGKNVYYCFYQMFNKQNESFGNVTKIKISI